MEKLALEEKRKQLKPFSVKIKLLDPTDLRSISEDIKINNLDKFLSKLSKKKKQSSKDQQKCSKKSKKEHRSITTPTRAEAIEKKHKPWKTSDKTPQKTQEDYETLNPNKINKHSHGHANAVPRSYHLTPELPSIKKKKKPEIYRPLFPSAASKAPPLSLSELNSKVRHRLLCTVRPISLV